MAYTKTTWVNDQAPDIDADNLNKMEQGIYDAQKNAQWGSITGTLSSQSDLNTALAAKATTTTVNTKANEEVIAAVEETTTATANHSLGEYILINSNHRLYRVTSAITAGQTISTSTNVERVTVGGELKKLNMTAVISSGSNLDDYSGAGKSGMYYCSGTTSNISNLPFNYCALIVVSTGSPAFQIAWNKNTMAFRGRTGSPPSWGEWHTVSFT